MRKELEEIKDKLLRSGWTQTNNPSFNDDILDTTQFSKNYYEHTIGIEVALEQFSLDCYGRYGVCSVFIEKYGESLPYLRDDIRHMETLIANAEIDLITDGIPFRPNYAFMKHTEANLDKNLDLREECHLDQYEREDLGK